MKRILYHGTTHEALDSIRQGGWRGLVYLTPSREEAAQFAHGVHLGGSAGKPVVVRVRLAPGAVKYAHREVDDAIMSGGDPDDVAHHAMVDGYRYVRFLHPSTVGEGSLIAYVSMFPNEDLTLLGTSRGNRR